MIRGASDARSISLDGRGGLLLKGANGTTIEPADVGPPPELQTSKREPLQKRSCEKNSWVGSDPLSRPAKETKIVKDGVCGGGSISVTEERSQSYSTSMSIGLSDIISLGVSTEFTEEASSSETVQVSVQEGQCGKLGFTATMECSTGKGTCNGEEVEGEVCCKSCSLVQMENESILIFLGPSKVGGDVAGTYRIIVES